MLSHLRNFIQRFFPMMIHWGNLSAFGCAVSFAGGIWAASMASFIYLILSEKLYPIVMVSAIVCSGISILSRRKLIMVSACFCAGSFFFMADFIHTSRIEKKIVQLETKILRLSGTVISTPAPWHNQFRCLFRINNDSGMHGSLPGGITLLCFSKAYLPVSSILVVEGTVQTAKQRQHRHAFDERALLRANGIAGKIYVENIISTIPPRSIYTRITMGFRVWLGKVLSLYRNPHHRAIIRASFTGEKEYIASEITGAFTRSGLIHLLALSGFNIAILLSAVYGVLAVFPLNRSIKHVMALVVVWLYFGFVGPIPSLTRAVIMATLIIFSLMLQRKSYPLQTLGIAGIVWLFFSPTSLFQADFQLSYGATFGILTLYPLVNQLYPGYRRPVVDYLGRLVFSSLSISCAAFLITAPIVLYHFGSVSVYGIFATVAAIPLLTIALWLFFAAMLFYFLLPAVSTFLLTCSGFTIDGLLFLAYLPDRISVPDYQVPVPYKEILILYYLFLIIIVTIERKRLRGILALSIPLFFCAIPGAYLIHRSLAVTEVVIFSGVRNLSITALRFPSGASWIFCKGDERKVMNQYRRMIIPWIRHHPGTQVRGMHIFTRRNQCVETGVITGQRSICSADTVHMMQNGSLHCRFAGHFIPDTHCLTVTVDEHTINIVIDNDSTCILHDRYGGMLDQLSIPVKIMIKSGKYAVLSYE